MPAGRIIAATLTLAVYLCSEVRAEPEPPENAEVLTDAIPNDDLPRVQASSFWPRHRYAATILGGPTAVYLSETGESALGVFGAGRFGWFIANRWIIDGMANYWQASAEDTWGFEIGPGAEYFLFGQASVRLGVGFGYVDAPEINEHFVIGFDGEAQYEVLSTPSFAISVGARVFASPTETLEGESTTTAHVFAARGFVALRIFGSRRFRYASLR